ncbi:MAG: sulfotransferase [Gemmatimonadota bacterium]|nr:MAG: sulfotransferase [Gemmatimonadota bacterium]
MKVKKWIFVTGAPRSATTFVGRILSAPLEVDYIHEPFNPECGIPGIEQRYLYLRAKGNVDSDFDALFERILRYDFSLRTGYYKNDTPFRRAIKRIIGSRGPFYLRLAKINPFHTTALIKDPIGCLLTEYLATRFGVRPLILVRHPVTFVASTLRLGWSIDISAISDQPELVEDYFESEEDLLWAPGDDPLEAAARLWRALNKVLLAQADQHPEWPVLTHEEVSARPVEVFRDLYKHFDLKWSPRIEGLIRRRTGPKNKAEVAAGRVQDFRRDSAQLFAIRSRMLSSEQRRRVFELTSDVAKKLYSEESFGLEN